MCGGEWILVPAVIGMGFSAYYRKSWGCAAGIFFCGALLLILFYGTACWLDAPSPDCGG